jgi:hypothetical protein
MEERDALRAYYERGMERERLSDGRGDLEFTRTTEIVLRRLPAAPAVVADIGGGPGRYARPGELRDEVGEAGLEVVDLVSVEGPAFILGDLDARMADPADRSVALAVARAIERVPELTGFGPHLIVTGIGIGIG